MRGSMASFSPVHLLIVAVPDIEAGFPGVTMEVVGVDLDSEHQRQAVVSEAPPPGGCLLFALMAWPSHRIGLKSFASEGASADFSLG